MSTTTTPIDIRKSQRLYLAADHGVQQRLEEVLNAAFDQLGTERSAVTNPYPQVLSVDCDYEILRLLGDVLQDEFNPRELDEVTCHLSDQQPNLPQTSELMKASKLSGLVNRLDGDWVRKIISDHKLLTFYQPILKTDDPSTVFGYECLTRGESDGGDVIAPVLLFGRAKKAGLINELDCAAYLNAVESIRKLDSQDRFLLNVCPAVAFSSDGDIRQMLEATTASVKNQIVIEITESERIDDDEALLNVLAEFRAAGVRLALDDVGSGYSSLNLLAELRPELIKIDMHLVRGASRDHYRACIVRKLIELAQELKIQTVAEGIETEDDWKWALDHGADYVQGFLFARPAPSPLKPSVAGIRISSGAEPISNEKKGM